MNNNPIFANIENTFAQDDQNTQRKVIENFLDLLQEGSIRVAYKTSEGWEVDSRVKQAILHTFKVGLLKAYDSSPLSFVDKHNLEPQVFSVEQGIRIVPGGSAVRRGAFVGKNVVMMPPSYINIGAYVDEGSMIDSHALVGSCAQIGKCVHISAGAQIGGVLEPVGSLPVIIEDDVLIGGNCGIYEGAQVAKGAVLGAGVILTKSTKVYDLVHERIITALDAKPLCIPEKAVVVMGARALSSQFAKHHALSISCPLIIKYRDEKTDSKSKLEDLLR